MLLTLTPDELLSTTRSVRKRLDFTRPVEPEVVRECLALAIQAPNFGNGQPWRWMVVSDPTKRQALGACYRRGYDRYRQPADSDRAALDHVQASEPERVARERRRSESSDYYERAAAEILGIPYETVTQTALLPVAYTIGTDFKPGTRQPLDDVICWNTWTE